MTTEKALAIIGYGKDKKIRGTRELVKNKYANLAVFPLGTEFDKEMLKEYRSKVVEIEIIIK